MSDSNRLRAILELVEECMAEPDLTGSELAGRAHLSRFYFDRLVRAAVGESPGAFRRRLLLERAAHRLGHGNDNVIDVALEAGYASPDAFTRVFARAYGATPTSFRRCGPGGHRLPADNGIHFHPPGGLRLPAPGRSSAMDVLIRMYDHHVQLVEEIVDCLAGLDDTVLDRRIEMSVEGLDEDPSLRLLVHRTVRQLEMWSTAIEGGTQIGVGGTSAAQLRERLAVAEPRFRAAVIDRVLAGDADETFLDATCAPPQTFSLGGVLAHVLTFSAARRTLAIGALSSAGITRLGSGDPMSYVGGSGDDASTITRHFTSSAATPAGRAPRG
ncbi:MAG: AraC family transcriptional regulator [Mycobacteriaceae bacterium]